MKLVNNDDVKNPKAVYLPHHAVVREDKETTKVRVVFNASSKGVNDVSLNDDLLKGPKLQQDLGHLLLRWRIHPIGIVADLVKMYRQVYVHEDDTDFQRILWRTKRPITKRKVLSDIARLYDPIGWIAPIVITAKVFIQRLWKECLDWDNELPTNLLSEWLEYRRELTNVKDISIPRWLCSTKESKLELHAFSDASSVAYAAAVYLRVVDENKQIHVRLVTAKTKVAPIEKEVSIPRLEICGATLAAKLLNEISQVLSIPNKDLYAWTDSNVVLAWLRGPVNRWATYVIDEMNKLYNYVSNKLKNVISQKKYN
ncbi:unnamed protein product, partial [Iphiclides podalirius]